MLFIWTELTSEKYTFRRTIINYGETVLLNFNWNTTIHKLINEGYIVKWLKVWLRRLISSKKKAFVNSWWKINKKSTSYILKIVQDFLLEAIEKLSIFKLIKKNSKFFLLVTCCTFRRCSTIYRTYSMANNSVYVINNFRSTC
jgi:hypothetical protein